MAAVSSHTNYLLRKLFGFVRSIFVNFGFGMDILLKNNIPKYQDRLYRQVFFGSKHIRFLYLPSLTEIHRKTKHRKFFSLMQTVFSRLILQQHCYLRMRAKPYLVTSPPLKIILESHPLNSVR